MTGVPVALEDMAQFVVQTIWIVIAQDLYRAHPLAQRDMPNARVPGL